MKSLERASNNKNKLEAVVKNLLKRAGKNIKEEWVDFNTMVSMSVYGAKRGKGASYKDPFNPNN